MRNCRPHPPLTATACFINTQGVSTLIGETIEKVGIRVASGKRKWGRCRSHQKLHANLKIENKQLCLPLPLLEYQNQSQIHWTFAATWRRYQSNTVCYLHGAVSDSAYVCDVFVRVATTNKRKSPATYCVTAIL